MRLVPAFHEVSSCKSALVWRNADKRGVHQSTTAKVSMSDLNNE
jgi:hypothetical protein